MAAAAPPPPISGPWRNSPPGFSPTDRAVRLPEQRRERPQLHYEPAAASIYGVTPYHQDNSFLIIGERLNASGSKKVRDLLNAEDWDGLVAVARGQVKENAHVLDVNVDYVGRDGEKDMHELVSRLVTNVNLPLMLDSTEWQKMEAGLKVAGGKCILNSTNYEDGDERFFKVLELARNYGAGVVVGTIDEEGMARTAERKFAIAQRAYRDALEYGIPAQEIFYDPLALPISTGIEEDRRNGAPRSKRSPGSAATARRACGSRRQQCQLRALSSGSHRAQFRISARLLSGRHGCRDRQSSQDSPAGQDQRGASAGVPRSDLRPPSLRGGGHLHPRPPHRAHHPV